MRWLATILLVVWAGIASAQTSTPLPSSTSETQATLAYGQIVLQLDNPSGFQQGQTVQVTSTTDGQTAVGTIVTWDPVLFNATISITTPNLQGNIYFSFFVQVLASAGHQVGIHPDLTAVSNTPYNGFPTGGGVTTPGTLKMTVSLPGSIVGGGSSGTISPTLVVGNVYSFTVPAGLYFPIQGNVQIDDLTPANVHDHYNGSVYTYQGTTLSVLINSVFGAGLPSNAWGLFMIAGPQSNIGFNNMNGLRITKVNNHQFTVSAGSVMDDTNMVVLTLSTAVTIDIGNTAYMQLVQQNGTVNSSGSSITGTGTAFTSNFSGAASNTDWNTQLVNNGLTAVTEPVMFGCAGGGNGTAITSVTDNTHMTGFQAPSCAANDTFYRGTTNSTLHPAAFLVVIAMNNSTGVSAMFISSFTPSGQADIPAGYTFKRVIGILVSNSSSDNTLNVQQLLTGVNLYRSSNTLAGDVNLTNTGTYFDGPSMAQGTSGTWWVSGSVVISNPTGNATVDCKLWDGTTVISSSQIFVVGANESFTSALSGYLVSPAGNIRISCKDTSRTTGAIRFNLSGNSADSSIWGIRIQ